jgi:hypothetical protein
MARTDFGFWILDFGFWIDSVHKKERPIFASGALNEKCTSGIHPPQGALVLNQKIIQNPKSKIQNRHG